MHARFLAPDLRRGDSRVALPVDEARHLLRVLRLRVGAPVGVFNGRGLECAGRVVATARDEVVVAIDHEVEPVPEPAVEVTLAQALLKGDAMDGVVRDAVMLGVQRIVPVLSAHVEGGRRGGAVAARVSRWQRVAVASTKQCGRACVPVVDDVVPLRACLASRPAESDLALVEPRAGLQATTWDAVRVRRRPATVLVCVGPEGGWADDDLAAFEESRVELLTLGRRTLRAEAAAIVGLSALQAAWGEFDR